MNQSKIAYDRGFYALMAILILALCLYHLKSCEPKPYVPLEIKKELQVKDSFRTVIRYHDSTRIQVLKKWRTITQIHDSTPCYTQIVPIIQACDTVIKTDSLLIVSLKGHISNDSVIQAKLFEKIGQDSTTISKLNKKLKRQKVLTKAAFILGFGSGGFIGFKVR